MIQKTNMTNKAAFETDSLESRNDTIKSILTATYSLADQGIIDNQKTFNNVKVLEDSNVTYDSGLSTYFNYSKSKDVVKSFSVNNQKAVEVEGIEPSDPWMISQDLRHVTPTASLLYQKSKVYGI